MFTKENSLYLGLGAVLGAGLGLLSAILFQKNIPLSILIGGLIGFVLLSVVVFLLFQFQHKE